MASTLVIEILEDGTLKTNAQKMVGSEKQILGALTELAETVGGKLKVEKHVPGVHHHHHGDGHVHSHGGGGGHKH